MAKYYRRSRRIKKLDKQHGVIWNEVRMSSYDNRIRDGQQNLDLMEKLRKYNTANCTWYKWLTLEK